MKNVRNLTPAQARVLLVMLAFATALTFSFIVAVGAAF